MALTLVPSPDASYIADGVSYEYDRFPYGCV